MKMEILLEPTSNKLMYDESNTYVLERFNTTAGNPVKEILLKLNLSDHMSILKDSKEYLKMVMEVGGFEIQFGREEFCLVTRLRFGVDISSEFIVGPFPFRRRVFPSCMDGHELRYTVPEWCFRLVDNKNAWNIYPCSSYVWPTLYEQLRDANVKRWETHFTIERQPDSGRPKYSLMGFTWAFKGAQPSLRLTPDVVEAQAEWWLSSKAFFDGYIREPPRISPLVNQHCRDDVPEYIYRRVVEQDNLLKAQVDKIKSHDDMIQQMIDELQPMRGGRPIKGQVYVGEHCGLIGPRMFTTPRNSFFDGVSVHALTYPGSFDQSMSSCVPKKQADKSRKKTSNANISAFDLGMVVGDDNARDDEVRITGARSTIDFISLENVDPNKVLRLNVECLSFLYNPELVFLDCHIKGFRAMESFWQELVPQMYKAGVDPGPDPAKVGWLPAGARSIVAKSKTASLNPCSNIFLLQTNRHLRGTLDGSTRPYPSWSDVYWVYMPINAEDSKRRAFWSLNEDILKITVSEDQYAISIKEDTAAASLPRKTQLSNRKRCMYSILFSFALWRMNGTLLQCALARLREKN
ncbi:hypothetical protein Tco_0488896 [Tanacetum coccineum]